MLPESAVTLAIVGILGTCVAGLIWVIKTMFSSIIPVVENGNNAIEKLVEMTKINTDATKTADKYLRDRNGRDAEMHLELLKATKQIPTTMQEIADKQAEAILTNIKQVNEQTVAYQKVDKVVISAEEKSK